MLRNKVVVIIKKVELLRGLRSLLVWIKMMQMNDYAIDSFANFHGILLIFFFSYLQKHQNRGQVLFSFKTYIKHYMSSKFSWCDCILYIINSTLKCVPGYWFSKCSLVNHIIAKRKHLYLYFCKLVIVTYWIVPEAFYIQWIIHLIERWRNYF